MRYTTVTDGPYLRDWLLAPGQLHWFPMSEGKELEDAVQCWIGFCRWNASLTATIDGVPCGIGTLFLMPYRKVAHHCLFKLIVDPKYRRQGIGNSIVKNLKHLAKAFFRLEAMHIEVFEANPLIPLLEKMDFYTVTTQDKYVKEGDRYFARVLMQLDL
jgi:RimJ/RimL family protein N-acetyltransferase